MIVQAAGDRTVPARFLLARKYRDGKYQHGKHE